MLIIHITVHIILFLYIYIYKDLQLETKKLKDMSQITFNLKSIRVESRQSQAELSQVQCNTSQIQSKICNYLERALYLKNVTAGLLPCASSS